MELSLARLAGATLMVAATTADDAIWLIPYISSSLPLWTRITHGLIFVVTLEVLSCGCVAIAFGLQWFVDANHDSTDLESASKWKWEEKVLLGSIGAAICWIIAISLYIRKLLKRRRKAVAKAELHRASTQQASNKYGSTDGYVEENEDDGEGQSLNSLDCERFDQEDMLSSQPSPWTVIAFTTLGALDEVSYFPSLILGEMFTPIELCLGTFLAACIVLAVVTLFLSQCSPILDRLDRIPLYGIVSTFAVALTAGVIIDVFSAEK